MSDDLVKVLLLDDEIMLGQLITEVIEASTNATVEHVRWIQDAVSELESDRYAVAIIDVWIGGVLALEPILAAKNANIPIVLTSGRPLPDDVVKVAEGASFYSKPIDIDDLTTAIKQLTSTR